MRRSTKRTGRILGVLASVFLGSGEEATPTAERTSSGGGGLFGGLVDSINDEIAAAADEMGEDVNQANYGIAQAAEEMGEATGQAEAAMEEAGEEFEGTANEAAAP